MAIDTRNRRASCLAFALAIFRVFPNPDGSLAAQEDRQHAAYSYPGILAGEAVVVNLGSRVRRMRARRYH